MPILYGPVTAKAAHLPTQNTWAWTSRPHGYEKKRTNNNSNNNV